MATFPGDTLTVRMPVPFGPLDLAATLSPLRQGLDDPTIRIDAGVAWRALRTRDGPATLHLRLDDGDLLATAVGPGAAAALGLAPLLAGLNDDPRRLRPRHRSLDEARRRSPGLRLTAGTAVFDALVWVILAQRVVGLDARRAYRELTRRLGEPAPGSAALLLPPRPDTLAATPYWTFHECNIERRRASVIVAVAQRARALDALAALPPDEARRRLQTVPGSAPGPRPRSPR